MSEEDPPRVPFVPLPMRGEDRGPGASVPRPEPTQVRLVYVRYRDPSPLEFPDRPERLPGPVFHVAGVLLREDDKFLALGEVALAAENPQLAERYGGDLFPAYRNVLTIPKAAILERRDLPFEGTSVSGPP